MTTCNIQVIDMPINNYSIILGRYWKALTSGYISLDATHMSLPQNGKNIIFLQEGRISPYIERVSELHVNYIDEDINVYTIFLEEDNYSITQLPDSKYGM
jgi:hypothetical protein